MPKFKSELLVVDPDRLRPNPWNSNFLTPDNEGKLGASLERIGQFKPVVVRYLPKPSTDTEYEILGGENRWAQLKAAGATEIQIFNLGEVDDDLAKEISLADNARYGTDDTLRLAEILQSIGADAAQEFLPYSDADISAICSSAVIALDELELPESFDTETPAVPELKPERAPKTHAVMRFKVPLGDAEKLTALITKIQKRQGYTGSDELTNAGDALVHLIFGGSDE